MKCREIKKLRRPPPFLIILTLAFLCFVGGCAAEIQHGLEESQANEIVAVLRDAGIMAEKKKEKGRVPTFTITVPRKDAANAFSVLSARNLPKQPRKGVYELFGKSSLVPTSTEEHMKKVYALQSELAKTLEKMEGVLDARVHLVIPRKDFFRDTEEPGEKSGASVFLKIIPDQDVAPVPSIQELVAGAVSGLEPGGVSVLIQPGAALKLPDKETGIDPRLLKMVTAIALAAVLLLGILTAVTGIRLKRLKKENRALVRDNTGSSSIHRTSSKTYHT